MFVECNNPSVLAGPALTFSVAFTDEAFSETTAADLGIRVPDSMHRAASKRKAEYVAGRFCARQAMRGVIADYDADLATRPDRGPAWPVGVVGSITHTAGFASAAICPAHLARGLGIDSERIMSDAAMHRVRDSVLSAHDSLPAGIELDAAVWTTLVFSAKESVFKCLYPLVNKMFWFDAVRIEIIDAERRAFRATLLVDLSPDLRAGTTLEGNYQIDLSHVHTGVFLAA